jgi:hypothetical protein
MNAEIILKEEEKEYLLQRAPEGSPARAILTRARPDDNQPALVIFSCNEQTAHAPARSCRTPLWLRLESDALSDEQARSSPTLI